MFKSLKGEKMFDEVSIERDLVSSKARHLFEWDKWCKEIPRLNFRSDWNVKIMPPFGSAIIRFNCEKNGNYADVYLDCYDELGCFGSPYWEIYPYNDDVYRCGMNETKELLERINEVLEGTDKTEKGEN
jgi:hypothetical protein